MPGSTLLLETGLGIIMPLFVAAISGYSGDKLALATFLTRITFPYLILISLVSLFSGILNSLARFTAAAFAPALLNLAMLTALVLVVVVGPLLWMRARVRNGHFIRDT